MDKAKRKIILILLLVGVLMVTAAPSFAAKGYEKQWTRGSTIGDIIKGIFSKVGRIIKDIIKRFKDPGKEPPIVPEVTAEFNRTALDNFGKVSIKSLEDIDDVLYYSITFKYSDGESEDVVGPVSIEESTTEIFYNSESPVTIKVYGENLDTPLHVFEDVYLELSE